MAYELRLDQTQKRAILEAGLDCLSWIKENIPDEEVFDNELKVKSMADLLKLDIEPSPASFKQFGADFCFRYTDILWQLICTKVEAYYPDPCPEWDRPHTGLLDAANEMYASSVTEYDNGRRPLRKRVQ